MIEAHSCGLRQPVFQMFDSDKARKSRIDRLPVQTGEMPLCSDGLISVEALKTLSAAEQLVLRHIVWIHSTKSPSRALKSRILSRFRERIFGKLRVHSDVALVLRVVIGNPSPLSQTVPNASANALNVIGTLAP